jgi:hypothetical protein
VRGRISVPELGHDAFVGPHVKNIPQRAGRGHSWQPLTDPYRRSLGAYGPGSASALVVRATASPSAGRGEWSAWGLSFVAVDRPQDRHDAAGGGPR